MFGQYFTFVNAHSVGSKIDELCCYTCKTNFDIFMLTESWAKINFLVSDFDIVMLTESWAKNKFLVSNFDIVMLTESWARD